MIGLRPRPGNDAARLTLIGLAGSGSTEPTPAQPSYTGANKSPETALQFRCIMESNHVLVLRTLLILNACSGQSRGFASLLRPADLTVERRPWTGEGSDIAGHHLNARRGGLCHGQACFRAWNAVCRPVPVMMLSGFPSLRSSHRVTVIEPAECRGARERREPTTAARQAAFLTCGMPIHSVSWNSRKRSTALSQTRC